MSWVNGVVDITEAGLGVAGLILEAGDALEPEAVDVAETVVGVVDIAKPMIELLLSPWLYLVLLMSPGLLLRRIVELTSSWRLERLASTWRLVRVVEHCLWVIFLGIFTHLSSGML